MNMRKALFYTFLSIFILAALVTLLGITHIITVDEKYLPKLFDALIIEVVGAVVTLFVGIGIEFFSDKSDRMRLRILFEPIEDFGMNGDPHTCTIEVFNTKTGEQRKIDVAALIREAGYLGTYLDRITEEERILFTVKNSRGEEWKSKGGNYLTPTDTISRMERK